MRLNDSAVVQRLEHLGDHRDRQVIKRGNLAGGHGLTVLARKVHCGQQSIVRESRYFQHLSSRAKLYQIGTDSANTLMGQVLPSKQLIGTLRRPRAVWHTTCDPLESR